MTRVDPPPSGDEAAQLRGYLDYHRETLRQKTDGLTTEQLAAVHPPSDLCLGGMVKHLAYVEEHWIRYVLMGRDYVEPWASAPWDDDADWEWHTGGEHTPAELRELYDATLAACDDLIDEALAEAGPGPGTERGTARLTARPVRGYDGPVNLRWVLVHLIEEYARHNGHADLIRESVDGVTGE